MKKRTIYVFTFLMVLSSCSTEESAEGGGSPKVSLSIAQSINQDVRTYFYFGEESKYELEEIKSDRSAPSNLQRKMRQQWNALVKMDQAFAKCIWKIEQMKYKVLKDAGFGKAVVEEMHSNSECYPGQFDISALKTSTSAIGEIDAFKKKELIEALYEMRTLIAQEIVSSSSTNDNKYSFTDPQTKAADVTSFEKFSKDFYQSIEKSTISPDDREILLKVYTGISFLIGDAENNIMDSDNLINAFSNLTNIEKQVFVVRVDAFKHLRSRTSGLNYRFTEVVPIISGPAVVKKGQSVEINIKYGAYNSYGNPVVKTNEAVSQNVANGNSALTIKGDKLGLKKISGTITVLSKSGEPKTIPWKHEIYVID